ncbi:MAG: dihydroorotase [Phycisphaerales bacterium]|nr:dihydroorotase [Planctomycetota bacterium]
MTPPTTIKTRHDSSRNAAALRAAPGACLVIRGGRVIDPASGLDRVCDVVTEGGVIREIGKKLGAPSGARVIEAEGLIVAPGLIDPHVHLREPGHEYKETIASGTAAAVAGGFTSICCMPNTSPAIDTPELVRFVYDKASLSGRCRVFPVAAGTKGREGKEIAEIQLLHKAGAVAFSDDGDCIASAQVMSRVFAAISQTGSTFMQHCQEPTLTQGAAMHAGTVSARLGLTGWPRMAEEIIIERDVRLLRHLRSPCRYHAQHVSSAGSVEIIRRARQDGLPVTGEATPHHLLLTHELCENYNTLAKVNPPLREAADVRAIVEGVSDGTITILGTDHAPHSAEEKSLPFEDAPMGMVGLEFALPLYAEALVASGAISWPRLIALLTVEPARLCGLDVLGLGTLCKGSPADITLIDTSAKWKIDPASMVGKSKNTPLAGRRLTGRAVCTIVGGVVVGAE